MTYEQLEDRIAAWAPTQPTVHAVILVGSRARGTPDRWSDLDTVIFTSDAERYAADSGWLGEFGDLLLAYLEDHANGYPEWYGVYAGGLKLDALLYGVEDAPLDLDAALTQFPYQAVLARGFTVLFDRSGVQRTIPPRPTAPPLAPTAAEFANVASGFLMASLTTAKFIARGDFWRAQRWFANDLRVHLLTLIEWHAQSGDSERDTWYAGRFIEQWADPRALAALPQTFPVFERDSLRDSLWVLLDLFRVLGEETAAQYGFAYPIVTHEQIAALVETLLAES